MAEEIVLPIRFENQFGDTLDKANKGLTELNEVQEKGLDLSEEQMREVKRLLSEVEAAAAKEAAAEKRVTAEKKKKLDAIKAIAREYGGPFGQALAKAIDIYGKISGAVSGYIERVKNSEIVLDRQAGLVTNVQNTFALMIKTIATGFPRAAKAVRIASTVIRTALISTGIGAIVVLVGALIAAFAGFVAASRETEGELTTLQKITNAVRSTFEALKITFSNLKEAVADFLNGTTGFIETLKNIAKIGGEIKQTVVDVANANAEIQKLESNNRKLEQGLANDIANTKDQLNQYNEVAADSNKTTSERVKAVKEAADIEAKLEKGRLAILQNNIKIAEQEASKYKEGTKEKEEAEKLLQNTRNELTLAQADVNARERSDRTKINGLYDESRQKVKELVSAYKDLLKQVQEQLQSEELSLLGGKERIDAELKIQLDAIKTLEDEAKKAARAAGQSFDNTTFERLRAIAKQKSNQEILELNKQLNEDSIALEAANNARLADIISASADEELKLEEAKAIFLLEVEREANNKRLQALTDYYAQRGTAITDAEQLELLALQTAIDKNANDEIKIRAKAKERVVDEGFKKRELLREIESLELDILTESGDAKLSLEQFVAVEKLKIQQQSLRDQLELAKQNPNATKEEKDLIEQKIKNLGIEIEKAQNPFLSLSQKLQQILKLDDAEFAAFTFGLETAVSNFSKAIQINAQLAAEAEQKIIDGLTNRINETEKLYQEELKLQEQGYANSADLYKKQLETLEAERQKAAEKAQERERKQANAQLLVDSALQVSNYVLSVTNILKDSTKFGLPGIALAIGGIAIIASIIAQAKANSKKFAEPPKFREGGWIEGASHAFGGRKIEAEGGEFIVNKQAAARNSALLEAINSNSLDGFDLSKAISARGLNLEPLLEKMNNDREVIVTMQQGIDYSRMEAMYLKASQETSEKVIGYLKSRPVRKYGSEGSEVLEWEEAGTKKRQVVKK